MMKLPLKLIAIQQQIWVCFFDRAHLAPSTSSLLILGLRLVLVYRITPVWLHKLHQVYAMQVNSLYHQQMQLPLFTGSTHANIFEAILQACSHNYDQLEGEEPSNTLTPPRRTEIQSEEKQENRDSAWFMMEETPFQSLCEAGHHQSEDLQLEIKRVKSLREEQETKIASFLRQGKYSSQRDIEIVNKEEASPMKSNQSLSPRKTKRIDKGRPIRLLQFD